MEFEAVTKEIRSVVEGGGVEKYVCVDALFLLITIRSLGDAGCLSIRLFYCCKFILFSGFTEV